MATKAQLAAQAKKDKAAAAEKAKGNAAASAPAAAQVDTQSVLDAVLAATRSEQAFGYFPKDAALAALVQAGQVEVRDDITDAAGNVAARITDAYMATLTALPPVAAAPAPVAPPQAPFAPPAATPAAPAAAPVASSFKIVSAVPMPAAKRFGKASVYPFDALVVGQAFFVPATKERDNPAKSMASTVNSANARYAVSDGFEADGTTPKFKNTRKFTLRRVHDGKEAGFGDEYAGVAGAGVWRTA